MSECVALICYLWTSLNVSLLSSMKTVTLTIFSSHRESEQRLKVCDDAFREQLEAKEKAYHESLSQLATEKDKEIAIANQKARSFEKYYITSVSANSRRFRMLRKK